MNILFTNTNLYLRVHEAFKLETLDAWAREYGFVVFARRTSNDPTDYSKLGLTNTYVSKTNTGELDEAFEREIASFIELHKPQKVMNNLEIFFPWHLVKTDATKIYFMRSCAAHLLEVIRDKANGRDDWLQEVKQYEIRGMREREYIMHSDVVIGDSINNKVCTMSCYGDLIDDMELALEYINPLKYNEVAVHRFNQSAYNVGRLDIQKGFGNLRKPTNFKFDVIGEHELNGDSHKLIKTDYHGNLDFDNYRGIIEKCPVGLFPSIWESNGYSSQECIAMGKVPIVQCGSGGNERFVPEGGITFDFGNHRQKRNWETFIMDRRLEIEYRMKHNKDIITYDMYRESFEKWIGIMV